MSYPIRPEGFPQDPNPGYSPQFQKKGENKSFSDFLSPKLNSAKKASEEPGSPGHPKETRVEEKKSPKEREDAWSVYGSASSSPSPQTPPTRTGEEKPSGSETTGQESRGKALASGSLAEGDPNVAAAEPGTGAEGAGAEPATPAGAAGLDLKQAAALADAIKALGPLQKTQEKAQETALDGAPPGQQKIPPEILEGMVESAENAVPTPKSGEKPDGIAAAQGRLMPRTAPEQDEIAPSAKRVNAANSLAASQNSLAQPTGAASALEVADRNTNGESESKAIQVDFVTPEIFEVNGKLRSHASGATETTPVRAANLEPVIASIHENVRFLRVTGSSHVELIFRPDQNTQLYMQVMKVNGEIQVQVRCEKGDAAQLSAAWGDVQNALASHGVRVEPLQNSSGTYDFMNFSGQNSRQQQEQSEARTARLDQLLPLNTAPNHSAGTVRNAADLRIGRPALAGQWQGWA